MKLSIDKVRNIISNIFGENSSMLQFYVSDIKEEKGLVGVVLDANGILSYCPEWWAEFINTPEKARHAIAFEIVQKLFASKEMKTDLIGFLALGLVTNSYLYARFGYSELPRSMYKANILLECLLRLNSKGFHTRFKRVYKGIWEREERFTDVSNVDNVLRILLKDNPLTEEEKQNGFSLLGINAEDMEALRAGESLGDSEQEIFGLSGELTDSVIESLNTDDATGQLPGFGETEMGTKFPKVKSHLTLETELIKKFTIDDVKAKVKKKYFTKETDYSVIPLRLSKRDALKLALDIPILFFEQEIDWEQEEENNGVIMYIDVSGSFWGMIPYALGIVENFRDKIDKVYFFSNKIYEAKTEALLDKDIAVKTTGGTDFDCIVEHAIKNKFKKLIIFTDGYGDINKDDNRDKTLLYIKDILTIIMHNDPNAKQAQYDLNYKSFFEKTWVGKNYKDFFCIKDCVRNI